MTFSFYLLICQRMLNSVPVSEIENNMMIIGMFVDMFIWNKNWSPAFSSKCKSNWLIGLTKDWLCHSGCMRCGGTVVIGLAVLLLSGVLQWSLVLASNQRLHLAMTGQSGNEDGAEKRELAGPALPSSGQMQACGEWWIPRMRFWGGYLWINEGAQEWLPQMRLGKQELGAIAEKLKWGLRFNYD